MKPGSNFINRLRPLGMLTAFVSWIVLNVEGARAAPIRLTIQAKGTNQVELTFSPVVPECFYQVLARTNGPTGHWIPFTGGFIGGSNKTVTATRDLGGPGLPRGLTVATLGHWNFVAGYWGDSDDDQLPDLYEDLVTRTDPYSGDDGYGDPDGDNWNNLQEMQNHTDPLRADLPPEAQVTQAYMSITNTNRIDKMTLTVHNPGGRLPDYFVLARADRTLRPQSNAPPSRPPPGQPGGGPLANRRPRPERPVGWPFSIPREDQMITGPFRVIGRIITSPDVQDYTYVETNVDWLMRPVFRARAHFALQPRGSLRQLDEAAIRQTLLSVKAVPTTNGYNLSVINPLPYGRYLLLERDRNVPQWRASGYFTVGTNSDPVPLHTDFKGMMREGQSPISLPEVKFLADADQPEFTAGWGEDSDGDGLPDIYEVLVTKTDPTNADTGNTGVLDGYKEMAGDGWSNLEKFRRRVDPLKQAPPPAPVVLTQPIMWEVHRAMDPRSNLRYEPQMQIRVAGTAKFQPIHQAWWTLYQMSDPHDPQHVRGNFDLRIFWTIPGPHPRQSVGGP